MNPETSFNQTAKQPSNYSSTTPGYPATETVYPSQPRIQSNDSKYVPPSRRKLLLNSDNASFQQDNPTYSAPRNMSSVKYNPTDSYSYQSRNKNNNFNSFQSSNNFGNDRWKTTNTGNRQQKYITGGKYSGASYNNKAFGMRKRESATGTQWDIRDGRCWISENPDEIFKKDKNKSVGINFNSYDSIPVDCTGRDNDKIVSINSFRETKGIHALLAENISRVQYERPTPVQKYSIPTILAGRDLMACAQTGSGKTAAFLFPIITNMLNEGPPVDAFRFLRRNGKLPALPVTLVLSPTRELAVQIYEESKKFVYNTGIQTVVLYGGNDLRHQINMLENGCDICVATPGRLGDLVKREKISFGLVKYLVLDEADRMLDMGFAPQIYSIVMQSDMPSSTQGRRTVMFSATFPTQIQKLALEFLHDYIFLTVGRTGATNDFITQNLIYANEKAKPNRLLNILSECKGGLMLVFVETKKKADLIEKFLIEFGLAAVAIHGDKTQHDREKALNSFRTGKKPILVATDVAARGLDIHNIEHVVNCDLPSRIDDYVHRIGRTGRAGNRGIATSFVNEKDRPVLRDLLGLLEDANQEIPTWFYDMVRSCTSTHRSFNYNSKSSYGKTFPVRGQRQDTFGGHDFRNNNRSGANSTALSTTRHYQQSNTNYHNNNTSSSNQGNNLRTTETQHRYIEAATHNKADEEDGW